MMKNKEMEADDSILPQEIIRDILTRLPVKSLIRFQCVCRHWRVLYRDPSFIADHLHHSNRQNPYILFQRGHGHDNHSDLYSLGSDMQVQRFQNPPLIERFNRGKIVGSSNGLLCVQTNRLRYSPHSLLLWNPAIKEVELVPETDICRDFEPDGTYSIGFGFCPSLNDYKIVITYVKYDFEMFKVYSSRSRSWKEVRYRPDAWSIYYGVTVNGVMYWFGKKKIRRDDEEDFEIVIRDDDVDFEIVIFSFDLATEVWTVIQMPEQLSSTVYKNIMVYEGKLAFVCCPKDLDYSAIHLWVREEGVGASGETWNWAKKFTSNPYPSYIGLFPKTTWGNEIICTILDSESTNVVLFNPTTEKFKELNISKCDDEELIFNYVESLVSVGETKSLIEFLTPSLVRSRRLSSSMMKNKEVEADDSILPQEIIRDILTRLPVKSLIRFQCVCRHWRDLYLDPSFIADHLHHSNRQNPYILFQRGHGHDNHSDLYSLGSDMQVQRFQNPPLIERFNRGKIVGSSNGLLCVQTNRLRYSPHSLLLWNPAIKEVELVPETDICQDFELDGTYSIGFGFCPSLNDYKIVITYVKYDFEMFKVYSSRSRSWKEVRYRPDAWSIYYGVTVNGVMYWFGQKKIKRDDEEDFEIVIFSFDLATEVWTVIPMPEQLSSTVYKNIMVYEGKLAFVCCPKDLDYSAIHLWVREEGVGASGETWNWAKKFTSNPYPSYIGLFPKTTWGNEIFCTILDSESTNVVLFNPTTEKFKELNISKCDDEELIFNYVESLASVGGKSLASVGGAKSLTKFRNHQGSSSWGSSSGVRTMI